MKKQARTILVGAGQERRLLPIEDGAHALRVEEEVGVLVVAVNDLGETWARRYADIAAVATRRAARRPALRPRHRLGVRRPARESLFRARSDAPHTPVRAR